MVQKIIGKLKLPSYPLITIKDKLLIWEKSRGMWKNRKPNPIQELRKIRKEWGRKLT